MPDVTPIYGWPIPVLSDPPDAPQQFSDLADAIETTLTAAGANNGDAGPANNVTFSGSAWTTVCQVSVVVPNASTVLISANLELQNTGTGRSSAALSVRKDLAGANVNIYTSGIIHMGGSSDSYGDYANICMPSVAVGVTTGTTIFTLQGYEDTTPGGVVVALKQNTLATYGTRGSRIYYAVIQ